MDYKKCAHCQKNLPIENFYKKGRGDFWSYCRQCESARKKQQLINFKRSCLEYKGQYSCRKCDYNKSITALDFHHVNPCEKDFNIAKCRVMKINDKIRKELDKCIVICSNCHRELHSLEEAEFIPKVLKPRSDNLCIDCSEKCDVQAQRCLKCHKIWNLKQSKCPSKIQLLTDLSDLKTRSEIAKKYSVSWQTINNWFKKYGIYATLAEN